MIFGLHCVSTICLIQSEPKFVAYTTRFLHFQCPPDCICATPKQCAWIQPGSASEVGIEASLVGVSESCGIKNLCFVPCPKPTVRVFLSTSSNAIVYKAWCHAWKQYQRLDTRLPLVLLQHAFGVPVNTPLPFYQTVPQSLVSLTRTHAGLHVQHRW